MPLILTPEFICTNYTARIKRAGFLGFLNNALLKRICEKFTERYLKKSGYKILERNYRQKCGEIDIIAQKGEYIIFTEVKTGSVLPEW